MNRLNYVSNVDELDILVRDENGIGLGTARLSENGIPGYISDMYQNRLNLTLLNDDELLEDISEGKLYANDYATLLEAVNAVLDFWCVAPTTEAKIEIIPQFNSLKEALSHFAANDDKYLVCSILYCTKKENTENIKNILWKYDKELGIAYFCPGCKKFLCGNEKRCRCGQHITWEPKDEYKGKVKWS